MSAPAPILELSGVVSGYGSMTVLRGVDLTVKPGQVVALLGKPAGVAIYPIADNSRGGQLRYSYTGYAGTLSFKKTILKDAYIEFDQNDIVTTRRVAVRQG